MIWAGRPTSYCVSSVKLSFLKINAHGSPNYECGVHSDHKWRMLAFGSYTPLAAIYASLSTGWRLRARGCVHMGANDESAICSLAVAFVERSVMQHAESEWG